MTRRNPRSSVVGPSPASSLRFEDIRQITQANYSVHVGWDYLDRWLAQHDEYTGQDKGPGMMVELNPEFQRGHVWTEAQQIAYIEYRLQGGLAANQLFWNCPGWQKLSGKYGPLQLVDGLQRLTAVQLFMSNKIPAFGHTLSEYTDKPDRVRNAVFVMSVNDLDNYADVLQWYIDLNTGGVVHANDEIDRVRRLLEQVKCGTWSRPGE